MSDTSTLVLDDPKDRFVDLTIFVRRPSGLVESGQINPIVGAWSKDLNGQAKVKAVCESISKPLRELYFVKNMVNTAYAHASKGSTLHQSLQAHMEMTLRKMYEERDWNYDQSLVHFDFRSVPDETGSYRTQKAADE